MQLQIRSADEPSTTFYRCVPPSPFPLSLLAFCSLHGFARGGGFGDADLLAVLCPPPSPNLPTTTTTSTLINRCCNPKCAWQWRED